MPTHPPTAPATPPPTPVRPPAGSAPQRSGRSRTRWLWMIVGGLVVLGKAELWRHVLTNPTTLVVAFAAGGVASILRTNPIGLAVCVAGLTALIIGPASTLVGVALGAGGFVALVVLFFAIGTILRTRQSRRA